MLPWILFLEFGLIYLKMEKYTWFYNVHKHPSNNTPLFLPSLSHLKVPFVCWYVVLHDVEQYGARTTIITCIATTKLFKMLISHTHDILNSLPFALFLSVRVVTQSTGSWLVWLLAWPHLAAPACVFISYGFVIYPRFACLFAFSSQTFRHLQNTKMFSSSSSCSHYLL